MLLIFSIIISGALFVITPVKDREDGLRHLLNFSGMTSQAYYFGIFMADLILFAIPCCMIIIMAFMFKIDVFTKKYASIFCELVIFGMSYVQFNYLIGFMFKKVEAAFKYQIFFMLLLYAAPSIVSGIAKLLFDSSDLDLKVSKLMLLLSPLQCLSSSLNQIFKQEDS